MLQRLLIFTTALIEKLSEQIAGQSPILPIDTILNLGRIYFSLYQSCFFQFLQMLRYCGFSNREFFMNIAKTTCILLGKKLKNGDSCRMPHSLGKASKLFLFDVILLRNHYCPSFICSQKYELFLFSQNNMGKIIFEKGYRQRRLDE